MYKGNLKLDQNVEIPKLETHIADCLRRIGARDVDVCGNRVSFTDGGVFRIVRRWDLLTPIGFGDLTIDPMARQIRYRLSFRQLLVTSTVLFGFLAVSGWYQAHSWQLIKMLPFMWLLLVGLSVVIGIGRFSDFLSSVAETAPRLNQ